MTTLSPDVRSLLERPIFAWATTLRANGSPHSTIVWADVDGDDVVFTTLEGRAKERHIRANPLVSVSLFDPENGWYYASISGRGSIDREGVDELLARLTRKFLGPDAPTRPAEPERIVVRLQPDRVVEQNRPSRQRSD